MKETVLTTMHEVSIVYRRPLFDTLPKIRQSKSAYAILKTCIDEETIDFKEFFWVLLLNNNNRVLGFSEIGRGDISGVIVNVREIFQLALTTNAKAIILAHNHPSGSLTPSQADIGITERVHRIGEFMSISLLDHLIITSEYYVSFADEGFKPFGFQTTECPF